MDGVVGIGDILFIFLVSALIYGLLTLKRLAAKKGKPAEDESGSQEEKGGSSEGS